MNRTPPSLKAGPAGSDNLRWEADTPIFSNRSVMLGMAAVVGIATLFLALLVTAIQVNHGRYEDLPEMLGAAAVVGGGVLVLFLLVSLVCFGGRVRMEVVIDGQGVTQTLVGRRSAGSNALAILAGAVSGDTTTAGAGLIGAAARKEFASYADLKEVTCSPKTREIRLHDAHRAVMQLYPPADRMEETLDRIRRGIASQPSVEWTSDISPIKKLAVVAGSIAFGIYLLADFPLEMGVLAPALMGATAVWMILARPIARPALGWMLFAATVGLMAWRWRTEPPRLEREGAVFALGLQMVVASFYALLGLLAGLGVFHSKPNP